MQVEKGYRRCRANATPCRGTASLRDVPIGRDKAKSRRFSKSKSACAGWSGKVPRLCAIWTPQCGKMKGKLCFVKRKSKNLVSNYRRFCEKNVSTFENKESLDKKLVDFLAKRPFFSLLPPRFFREDARSFAHHDTRRFLVCTSVRANGHAPAHRALSEFAIPAFTLTRNSLIQCVLRVKEMPFFCLHR